MQLLVDVCAGIIAFLALYLPWQAFLSLRPGRSTSKPPSKATKPTKVPPFTTISTLLTSEHVGTSTWVLENYQRIRLDPTNAPPHPEISTPLHSPSLIEAAIIDAMATEKVLLSGYLLVQLELKFPSYKGAKEILEQARTRFVFAVFCSQRLNSSSGWVLSQQSLSGDRSVFYRRSATPGNLSVKVSCELQNCQLIHLLAHGHECHTARGWIPMCFHSEKVCNVGGEGTMDAVVQVAVGMNMAGISRDLLLRFFCNDSLSSGTYHFFSHSTAIDGDSPSIYSWKHDGEPPRARATRIDIQYCAIEITLTSPNSFVVEMMAELDPKLHLVPEALVNYALRKIMYVAIGILEGIVQRMAVDEGATVVGQCMALDSNRTFYDGYRAKIDAAVARLFGEDDTVYVCGWGTKKMIGQVARTTRRFFVAAEGVRDSFRYYEQEEGWRRGKPRAVVAVDDCVEGPYVEGEGGRSLVFSERVGENKTRLVGVTFDDGEVAKNFQAILGATERSEQGHD